MRLKNDAPDMTDVAFGLTGELVPQGYAFALWQEVARCLPWLAGDEFAGIIPLRTAVSGDKLLLPQRAKLVLRLAVELAPQAKSLSGQELDVGGNALRVGGAVERPLTPHPTLHAQLVEGAGEEEAFLAEISDRLREMEIACKLVCGKRQAIADATRRIAGYSLVLHDLKPEGSLHIQRAGLGGSRHFGCGIFVPHKNISGLS